jgi:hypothetical protein
MDSLLSPYDDWNFTQPFFQRVSHPDGDAGDEAEKTGQHHSGLGKIVETRGLPTEDATSSSDTQVTEPITSESTATPRSTTIIAVDLGTTYSSVSYARIKSSTHRQTFRIDEIRCISTYPNGYGGSDARDNARIENVPTQLMYLTQKSQPAAMSESSDIEKSSDELRCLGSTIREVTTKRKRCKTFTRKSYIRTSHHVKNWTRAAGVSIRWGFQVQEMQKNRGDLALYQTQETVKLIKLTLGSNHAELLNERRAVLNEQVARLQAPGCVYSRDHLFEDYLTRLLHHAKRTLRRQSYLMEDTDMEFVLCVPVSWSESDCRVMHNAMVKAIDHCNFGTSTSADFRDLFIVSEPEAAAQFVLAKLQERLRTGEVFILLDAGGGTVDITTYRVTKSDRGALRLEAEAVEPDGDLCGSALIGERYAAALKRKLQAANFPADIDLDAAVNEMAIEWDMSTKPTIDYRENQYGRRRNFIHGFSVKWSKDEIQQLFDPSVQGVLRLLRKQLALTLEAKLIVSKVIVVGGFGESPVLQDAIEEVIAKERNLLGSTIRTIWPHDMPTTAVVRGALLRAINKEDGPKRKSRSSFGFLRHEQYKAFPEHEEAGVVSIRDRFDGRPLVHDTLNWLIQAVSPCVLVAITIRLYFCAPLGPALISCIRVPNFAPILRPNP